MKTSGNRQLGLAIVVVLGLITYLLILSSGSATAQESGTPTPTVTPTPATNPPPGTSASDRDRREADEPPWQVRNLDVTPGDRTLQVSWQIPSNAEGNLGVDITHYLVDYRASSASGWTRMSYIGYTTSVGLSALTNGVTYQVRVSACNQNCGSWSSVVEGTPVAPPPDPEIEISGLDSSMPEGDDDRFTVRASNLNSSLIYTIRVTASDSDIGFNSACSDDDDEEIVPSGSTSHSADFRLYGCETNGGTVRAYLRQGSTDVTVVTQDVNVTEVSSSTPTPTPTATPSSGETWSAVITSGRSGDDYGYKSGSFGSITDDTFSHDGTEHRILSLKWEDEDESDGDVDDITVRLHGGCLRPSDVDSLTIGSQTYDELDNQLYSDAQCDRVNPPSQQLLIYHSPGNNPFSSVGVSVNITLEFAGESSSSTPTPTPTPTLTPTPTPTPTPEPADCVSALGEAASISGSWVSGCESTNRTARGVHYARYYTFTLAQRSDVTITLESDTDTSLFVLEDMGKNGTMLHENDDDPNGGLNSRIEETLAAGDYTIEATTYKSRATGDFTLGVAIVANPTAAEIAAELDTAIAMIAALNTAVSGNSDFTTAQTALANCINRDASRASVPVSTFDAILGDYNTYKPKLEPGGDCDDEASTMFTTLRSVSQSELRTLKGSNSDYATLLSTPAGIAFERDVGNADIIKLYASLAAPSASSDSGGGSRSPSPPIPTPREGVNCLMPGETAPTNVAAKIEVLNCLAFDTPRSFWVTQSENETLGGDLATAGNPSRYAFLGYGDWTCTDAPTNLPEHPFEPSCVKHDVAYASLQKFVGTDSPNERDSAWNFRNKYLADITFHRDLQIDAANWENPPTSCQFIINHRWIPFKYKPHLYFACKVYLSQPGLQGRGDFTYLGVAIINSKLLERWPVWKLVIPNQDKTDARQNPRYVEYS